MMVMDGIGLVLHRGLSRRIFSELIIFAFFNGFFGLLGCCFGVSLYNFLFPQSFVILSLLWGVAMIVSALGAVFFKEIFRRAVVCLSLTGVIAVVYMMVFAKGLVLPVAYGVGIRLIPYPIGIAAAVCLIFSILYLMSHRVRSEFEKAKNNQPDKTTEQL
jgi:hypothetical protein